jgi:hypothetical protein
MLIGALPAVFARVNAINSEAARYMMVIIQARVSQMAAPVHL